MCIRDSDAAAWTSTDGLTWTEVDLAEDHMDGDGDQRFQHAIVAGDDVHLLVRDVPPGGGGYYTLTTSLPTNA